MVSFIITDTISNKVLNLYLWHSLNMSVYNQQIKVMNTVWFSLHLNDINITLLHVKDPMLLIGKRVSRTGGTVPLPYV